MCIRDSPNPHLANRINVLISCSGRGKLHIWYCTKQRILSFKPIDLQWPGMQVIFEFFVPLENFLLIWRRHHCRWRAACFNLCSAPMAIEQWGFFSVPHLLEHGLPFLIVTSEDPWHSHLLRSVWQWSCHYLFLRLWSVATGDRTLISSTRGERSTSTPLWRYVQ